MGTAGPYYKNYFFDYGCMPHSSKVPHRSKVFKNVCLVNLNFEKSVNLLHFLMLDLMMFNLIWSKSAFIVQKPAS